LPLVDVDERAVARPDPQPSVGPPLEVAQDVAQTLPAVVEDPSYGDPRTHVGRGDVDPIRTPLLLLAGDRRLVSPGPWLEM